MRRVAEPAVQNPAPACAGERRASLCATGMLPSRVHPSDPSKPQRLCLLGSMVPSDFLRKLVCSTATPDSSPQEVAFG